MLTKSSDSNPCDQDCKRHKVMKPTHLTVPTHSPCIPPIFYLQSSLLSATRPIAQLPSGVGLSLVTPATPV